MSLPVTDEDGDGSAATGRFASPAYGRFCFMMFGEWTLSGREAGRPTRLGVAATTGRELAGGCGLHGTVRGYPPAWSAVRQLRFGTTAVDSRDGGGAAPHLKSRP